MAIRTVFGSLTQFEKGGIQIIRDDPRNYAFSNVFEVASKARPWEKVAVARNMEYVLEAVRAEGTSPWYAAAQESVRSTPPAAHRQSEFPRGELLP